MRSNTPLLPAPSTLPITLFKLFSLTLERWHMLNKRGNAFFHHLLFSQQSSGRCWTLWLLPSVSHDISSYLIPPSLMQRSMIFSFLSNIHHTDGRSRSPMFALSLCVSALSGKRKSCAGGEMKHKQWWSLFFVTVSEWSVLCKAVISR